MRHIEINLPFGLPPADAAAELVRGLHAPSIATLISRTRLSIPPQIAKPFARALPHEIWLCRQFGIEAPDQTNTSPPIAAELMQSLGIGAEEGFWFILNPAHIRLAQDRLALNDPRRLALNEAESRALFESARPCFDEAGKRIMYGNAATWFVRADDWEDLRAATPDAACGHSLEFWLPEGPGDRSWRRLHNEVQMLWHAHSVNQERERAGLAPVNALWLWGGARDKQSKMTGWQKQFSGGYAETFRLSGWMNALVRFVPRNLAECTADEMMALRPQHGLLMLDGLTVPALDGDWASWLEAYRELEENWFFPLLSALQNRKTDRLTLHVGNNKKMLSFTTTRLSLRKFWVEPTLMNLLP